jgi:hypothetical protein
LLSLGLSPSVANDQKVASALDAAYEFDVSLWELARTSNYDYAKHDTDWTDHQQLYYLCAADVHFVTSDKRLMQRISGSGQAARVMSFDALRSLALTLL